MPVTPSTSAATVGVAAAETVWPAATSIAPFCVAWISPAEAGWFHITRAVSAAESITGLVMFAWSTSAMFNVVSWVTSARLRYVEQRSR